jgi:hypothetical protein
VPFMYMTPRMRADLIRFGDVIFLDAQQNVNSLNRSTRLQHRDQEDGSVVVWPANVTDPLLTEEEKQLVIPEGGLCPCVRRRMYLIQCEHEYNTTKNIEKEKYHNRWYNRDAYCLEVSDLTANSFFKVDDSNQTEHGE